ncbi:hypothetical protein BGZ81_010553, partial [Podila clonocystis]
MEDKIQIEYVALYVAVRSDVLDEEYARIENSNPVQMEVRQLAEGKDYFGRQLEDQAVATLVDGSKMVLSWLMEYNCLLFGASGGGGSKAQKVQEALA